MDMEQTAGIMSLESKGQLNFDHRVPDRAGDADPSVQQIDVGWGQAYVLHNTALAVASITWCRDNLRARRRICIMCGLTERVFVLHAYFNGQWTDLCEARYTEEALIVHNESFSFVLTRFSMSRVSVTLPVNQHRGHLAAH